MGPFAPRTWDLSPQDHTYQSGVSWVLCFCKAEHKLWLKVDEVLNSTVNTVSSFFRIPSQVMISPDRQDQILPWMYQSNSWNMVAQNYVAGITPWLNRKEPSVSSGYSWSHRKPLCPPKPQHDALIVANNQQMVENYQGTRPLSYPSG